MRVLIDGHNAMGALRIRGPSHEAKRDALLARVAAVAPGATVYFDARKAPAAVADTGNRHGVRVVFCRRREADDAILEAVRDAPEPGRIVVVTNDGEVRGRAGQLGAQAIGVAEFFGPPAGRGDARPRRRPPRGRIHFQPKDFGLPDEVDLANPGDALDDDE